jgi:superfamily II helicase
MFSIKEIDMQNIDILKLYGFPEQMVSRWKTNGVQNLLPIQFEAIQKHRLFDGGNLVVSAPTSSGKTMIGELTGRNFSKGSSTCRKFSTW